MKFKSVFPGWKTWALITFMPLVSIGSTQIDTAIQLRNNRQWTAAYTLLKEISGQQTQRKDASPGDSALVALLGGQTANDLQNSDEALEILQRATAGEFKLRDFTYYEQGKAFRAQKKYQEAQKSFEMALDSGPSTAFATDILLQLGAMEWELGDFKKSYQYFVRLEKITRQTEKHPDILLSLYRLEKKLGKSPKACTWAKQIFSKYPASPLWAEWSIELSKNKIDGEETNCVAGFDDQKKRIKKLQMAGEGEKALGEIKNLQSKANNQNLFALSMLLADHLVSEGMVDDSLKLLLKDYQSHQKDYNFLMLLAKAAARSNEFQIAVSAYHRAYELNKRSVPGRKALFQSAFLSYQFQDYDGAYSKFTEFIKSYPTSGLSRDAKWHLAWIRYLKGDYEQADRALALLQGLRQKNPRAWRSFSPDRLDYWRAITLMKLGRFKESRTLLEGLSRNNLLDYYTVAAQQRLVTLVALEKSQPPGSVLAKMGFNKITTDKASAAVGKNEINEQAIEKNEERKIASTAHEPTLKMKKTKSNVAVEDETEELLSQDLAIESGDSEDSTVGEGQRDLPVAEGVVLGQPSEGDSLVEENVKVTDFKDPRLSIRFDRSQILRRMGLNDLARYELNEIEKRTSNSDFRKTLVSEYQNVQAYNRSSYIASIYFGGMRAQYGIQGVRYMWEYAYPKAYENSVQLYSRQNGIPRELVWSIIRAETQYRKEAVSPVGALGLMQIMPNTGRQLAKLSQMSGFQVTTLLEPEMSIRLGSKYLSRLMKIFKDRVPLTAAAYNAGPHRVQSWLHNFGHLEMDEFIEHIPFLETRNYVKRVVSFFHVYKSLYSNDKQGMSWLAQPVNVPAMNPLPTKESWDAI